MTKKHTEDDGLHKAAPESSIDPDGDATLPDPMDVKFLYTDVLNSIGTDSTASQNIMDDITFGVVGDAEKPRGHSERARAHTSVCLTCGQFFEDGLPFCRDDGTALRPILTQNCLTTGQEMGRVLDGRYLIGRRLSHSHHAIVVEAKQVHLDRDVVIKFVAPGHVPTGPAAQSLHREAAQTAALDHPRIVKVLDFGIDHGQLPYLAMERLHGRCLAETLSERGPLSEAAVIQLGLQICQALSYIHDQGIIHRDMKPSNVWCLESASNLVDIKLLDFGLCQTLSGSSSPPAEASTDLIVGTPNYMAPEQCRGEPLDQRADIYSLGCVLWEALTGRPLVRGNNTLDSLMIHNHAPVSRPSRHNGPVSKALETAIMVALEKDRNQRWNSAHDMGRILSGRARLQAGHII